MSSIELTTSNNYYHTFMEPPKNSPKLRMFLINVQENIYEEDKVKRFFSTTGYAILVWATSFFQVLTFSAKCFETCMFEIWYLDFSEMQEHLKCNAENVALSLKYTIAMPFIIFAGMFFPKEIYSSLDYPQDAPIDIEQEYARVNQERDSEEEGANRVEEQVENLLDELDREMTEHHADIADRDQLQVNLNIARTAIDTLNAERDQLAWDVQIERRRADDFEEETTRLQTELTQERRDHGIDNTQRDEFDRDFQEERQRADELLGETNELRTELAEEKRTHGIDKDQRDAFKSKVTIEAEKLDLLLAENREKLTEQESLAQNLAQKLERERESVQPLREELAALKSQIPEKLSEIERNNDLFQKMTRALGLRQNCDRTEFLDQLRRLYQEYNDLFNGIKLISNQCLPDESLDFRKLVDLIDPESIDETELLNLKELCARFYACDDNEYQKNQFKLGYNSIVIPELQFQRELIDDIAEIFDMPKNSNNALLSSRFEDMCNTSFILFKIFTYLPHIKSDKLDPETRASIEKYSPDILIKMFSNLQIVRNEG